MFAESRDPGPDPRGVGGDPPTDFPNYEAGTWAPESAEVLIAQDGRSWLRPTSLTESPH